MPKNEIDYSKTVIYKIYCKDDSIKDVYIGHTTSFIKRKYQHKISSNNINNNLNIYKVIRQYGGWENWEMIELSTYNCKNSEEARIKEQEHYEQHNASLNSYPPYVDNINKHCDICNLQFNSKSQCNKHISSKKHIYKKNIIDNDKKNKILENSTVKNSPVQKNLKKYYCQKCDFGCSKNNEWERHLITAKHNQELDGTNKETTEQIKPTIFICECKKEYKNASGLWKHKQKCSNKEIFNEICDKELILMLIKQNAELIKDNNEFKNIIMELIKNGTHNTTNSHNKTI